MFGSTVIPIKAPIGTGPETSEVTPEIKNSDPIHSQDDQHCQKCDDSEKQSTVRANLNNHIKNYPFVFAYNCTECGKGFSHKSNLSSHKRSHIDNNSNKPSVNCTKCKKSFQNKQHLLYHMNKEHVDKLAISCKHCETEEAQQQHSKNNHLLKRGKSIKIHFLEVNNCTICENVFINDALLGELIDTEHMDTESNHTIETPTPEAITPKQIQCALEGNNCEDTDCTFQCNIKEDMERHIDLKHQRKQQLQCTVCNLYFRNLDDLARHMGVAHRTGQEVEPQVKCNRCGLEFPNKNEIENHLMVDHKTYRPCKKFAEDNCKKDKCRFPHIKPQQGQEVCYQCGNIFMSKTDLINHP